MSKDATNGQSAAPASSRGGGSARRLGRWISIVLGSIGLLTAAGYGALAIAKRQLGPPPLEAAAEVSTIVLDRHDRLLRAFTTADGRWRMPVEPDQVDKRYLRMLFAFEDQRFREHSGVDLTALLRAAVQLVQHQRIVSGGSTLTMQVARLLDGRHERSFSGKLAQIVRALQLEERLSKDDILRLYLRLAPFGGNLEGVRAASLAYFGKEPRRLSVGEAALLVALPQSPETRRPDRAPHLARLARDRVLDRAVAAGVISEAEAARARDEPVPKARRAFPKLAPHLSEADVADAPERNVHRLTIDKDVQVALETLAEEQTKLLGQKLSSAILALDHTTGEVIAHVGSADYLDQSRLGAIDMVRAVRSPGSTLKPVIYGLAFESGLAHPETLIEDRPVRFGSYAPQNFDEDFRGTVTVREALAHSLNIPAVKVLNAVGPARLVDRLRRLNLDAVLPPETEPTLAIALGGIGLRLEDLARLYAALARGGEPIEMYWRRDPAPKTEEPPKDAAITKRLLSPLAAWYVTDILKDAPPPASARSGRIAYKTGTSYGYRDAWAIGYDGRHTVAVWVGRADGASTPGLMGRVAAAPILFDAFARLGERRVALAVAPPGVLRATGADLPPPLRRFREGSDERAAAGPFIEPPVVISFPPDRAVLELEDGPGEPLQITADGGVLPLTWLIDGAPIASDPHRRQVTWAPEGPGFVKLSVIDAKGRVDRVTVRLK